ncbi:MAG TPA: hypothetical protein VET85_03395 [Stellaceae bacterium]|nr:hypothetical protein [Stellaceae bacterium]
MSDARSTFAGIAQIAEAIAAARRGLTDGALVDLAGLDTAIAQLCEAAGALSAGERPAVAAALAALAETLDALRSEIAAQGEAAQRRRAAEAYGGGEEAAGDQEPRSP